jgi:hypothetical protein
MKTCRWELVRLPFLLSLMVRNRKRRIETEEPGLGIEKGLKLLDKKFIELRDP